MTGIKTLKTPTKSLSNGNKSDTESLRSSISSGDTSNLPSPRLCHIIKWPGADGYGFHLLSDKSKPGQFIGNVDPCSPASEAGILAGDRIVEVNGSPTVGETHKNVIEKIKAVPNETKLLVVDPETDKYYKERNIAVSSSMSNVKFLKTPSHAPKNNNNVEKSTISSKTPLSQKEEVIPASAPIIRLCIITKPANEGFGFHLLSDKSKAGKFIGPIESNSPAFRAGLREGDRLVEVNGANAEELTHKEIVMRIKDSPNETKLLVVDADADGYYRAKGIQLSSKLSTVKVLRNTEMKLEMNGLALKESKSLNQINEQSKPRPQSQISVESYGSAKSAPLRPTSSTSTYELSSRSTMPRSSPSSSGLDLPMSAAEMRARLLSKKKYDPKKEAIDLRKKYEIIQSM
ncbi:Na(+)/H(+) exchange regulatory cofactor NHE-RF2-like isoform X2 [Artemia franciscana]|nr:hypothetical protein QYM36_013706 [Artemia franciscana]